MIRALVYILLLAMLAIGLAWFADRPGELTINWLTYQIEIPLFWVTVAIIIAAGLLLFAFSFISKMLSSPRRLRRHLKNRRRTRGYAALRRGIFAVGAGDEEIAARYAIEARRALKSEPLTELLRAQSAQLSGDHRTAQRIFEAMSENSETRLLGLRGLFLEASREGEMEPARQYAARAMALNPALPWPVHALFDMQCRARDWHGALETLTVARNHRHLDRKTLDRRRAVLLTAQAQELETTQANRAAELALEAHRLAPDFVPAAVIAGRILAAQGNSYKAARTLARTWQYAPHPDLALGYAYVRPGDSPRDRLGRIQSLIVMTPDDPEARIALASAAVDAREWQEARDALAPLIGKNPTARVCALMARIEGGEKRDAGRVREWLARAVRAPRDAVWMADGVISNEWQPLSPVTGALDAFEWRVPPDQLQAGKTDPLLEDIAMLSQELETAAKQIADANLAEERGAKPASGAPLTITVTAEETGAGAAASPARKDLKSGVLAPEVAEDRSAFAGGDAGAELVAADARQAAGRTSRPAAEASKAEPAPNSPAPSRSAVAARAAAPELTAEAEARALTQPVACRNTTLRRHRPQRNHRQRRLRRYLCLIALPTTLGPSPPISTRPARLIRVFAIR